MKLIIDKKSNRPIYKQIALQFEDAIKSGIFKENDKLPTEKELLKDNKVAKGTIKCAYNELENKYYVKKIQGSGTYVLGNTGYKSILQGEHIVQDVFSKLSFAKIEEIYSIFMKELSMKNKNIINMAWIDCSPEVLAITEKQILKIPNLSVTKFQIDDIVEKKSLLDNSYDIIATTQSHYSELIKLAPNECSRIEKLGLSVSDLTVAEIAKVPTDKKIAILYKSKHFLENIIDKLNILDKKNNIIFYGYDCDVKELEKGILDAGALLVPPDYLISSNENIVEVIRRFMQRNNKVITFEYLIDRGSLFHLELKVQQCYINKFEKRELNEF